ncbi:MAG: ATP-dependent zinc metalloprotease FtsH [Candidatus Absconditabacterales bacterium]|nr:ATP-dependent zinc metalloprotease FtsH [Candidatus Absconditabacterales bacterium]
MGFRFSPLLLGLSILLSLLFLTKVFSWGQGIVEKFDSKTKVSLDEFLAHVQSGSFVRITEKNQTTLYGDIFIKTGQTIQLFTLGEYRDQVHYRRFETMKPANMTLTDLGIDVTSQKTVITYSGGGFWAIFWDIAPLLLITLVTIFFLVRVMGMKGGGLPFAIKIGKLVTQNNIQTKFSDVAGMDEVKEDLYEIVDYLKNPKKYSDVGARPPKGILLYGQPGSGKTLLAKAIAGEADASFFSASGSEFMEMLVGMGAAKVRELFSKAKASAPAIIFIDEIDTIGKKRGGGHSGGHQEQEQTLNQILTEMDGIETSTNVIVIAATNRPDTLDPALMRSGRFDRKIMVGAPTFEERKKIIDYYLKNKKIDSSVSVDVLAKRTSGFVGADIENMINEAALKIARDNRKKITAADLEFAFEKVIMGSEKKIKSMVEKERRIVAYHELGHAVCGYHLSETDTVEKISIVSRGGALGMTITLPEEDKYLHSKKKFLHDVIMLLGGRAAEELFIGADEITTGASNDFMRATKIVRDMYAKYGMDDELGQILWTDGEDSPLISRRYSEQTAQMLDTKIKATIASCYTQAKDILAREADRIHRMAEVLLEKEYLIKEDFEAMMMS